MNRWLTSWFLFCSAALIFADAPDSVRSREFLIEPIPDWTTPGQIEEKNNPLEKKATDGVFTLLFNIEINEATRERFVRIAQKYISTAGVEANSRLSFTFDPAYEQLVLHKIVIHRGDQILDQLEPERIRVIQQEKELDRLIYNGSKTALLFLEDVRVGDWVEFAYTIRGRNPIEAGHFSDALSLGQSFPIQTENYRLLWPRTNQTLWAQTAGDAPKNRRVTDQFYEYAWHWENRPGVEPEDFVPSFMIQYATVHFSDYKTWEDVAKWAEQSFRSENISEDLFRKITEIRDENKTDEQRILKALQFVQDNIRYLGIENGVNSHQPTDPSVVFARGYGDCKDKALLFCTMLRFFDGVDASPVLVSTRFQAAIKNFIPTPLIFDHVIVRVMLDGKPYFVDVTRSNQRGPLNQRFINYFRAGVLLDPNAPGLITIPETTAGMPKTTIEEHFDIATNGGAAIVVTNTYHGRDADFMRQTIASLNQDAIEKNFLSFYQKYYKGIVSTAHTRLLDDEQSNRIQIIQHYSISNIWNPSLVQTNYITCDFVSFGIFDRLYIPTRKERKFPLAMSFPENYIHTIRINPHESWQIVPKDKTIRAGALVFHHRTAYTNHEFEITCQMASLRPAVKPTEMTEYWAALDEIPHLLDLVITKPVAISGKNESANWSVLLAGIFYCVMLSVAAIAVYRYKPKEPPELLLVSNPNLQGLGGWLILLGFGLVVAPFVRINGLIKISTVFTVSRWNAITNTAAAGYDPTLAPILLYELFLQLTLIVFSFLILFLFFRKKRIFGTALIVLLSIQFLGFALDEIITPNQKASLSNSPPRSQAAPTFIPLVAWGLYISRSKRVKLTFIN